MHWPGVLRVSLALLLVVLLVVLVATSEVVWKRGWWVFTTELVLPAFVGIAGTAVAVAAFSTSKRATDLAERATLAEAERLERAERTELVNDLLVWLEGALEQVTEHGVQRSGAIRENMSTIDRKIDLVPFQFPVNLLVHATADALERIGLAITAVPRTEQLRNRVGPRVYSPTEQEQRDDLVTEAEELCLHTRFALLEWQRERVSGTVLVELATTGAEGRAC